MARKRKGMGGTKGIANKGRNAITSGGHSGMGHASHGGTTAGYDGMGKNIHGGLTGYILSHGSSDHMAHPSHHAANIDHGTPQGMLPADGFREGPTEGALGCNTYDND